MAADEDATVNPQTTPAIRPAAWNDSRPCGGEITRSQIEPGRSASSITRPAGTGVGVLSDRAGRMRAAFAKSAVDSNQNYIASGLRADGR